MDNQVYGLIQYQRLKDYSLQAKAIVNKRSDLTPVSTYQGQDTISGFHQVQFSNGSVMYGTYRSTGELNQGDIISGISLPITLENIGQLDATPATSTS